MPSTITGRGSNSIVIEKNPPLAWVYLNRPEKLNVLTLSMAEELCVSLKALEKDAGIKVVLVAGKGKNFCAGADVNQFVEYTPMEALNFHRKLNEVGLTMRYLLKPVIAVLNGYALGGGLELAESADIRLASSSARLGQPEVDLGINAGAGGNVVLPRLVGRSMSMYLALTGEIITAREAFRIGLVDLLVPESGLKQKASELAMKIAQKPFPTVEMIKSAINHAADIDVKSALEYEASLFGLLFSTRNTKDAVSNFLKKKSGGSTKRNR
jgi:enoyl-CoA hydratase/carnithine racemase